MSPQKFWIKQVKPETKWQTSLEFEHHVQKFFFLLLEPLINCFDNLAKVFLELQTRPYIGAGMDMSTKGYFVNICSSPIMDRQGNYHWHRLKSNDLLVEFNWYPLQKSTVVTRLQLPEEIGSEHEWAILELLTSICTALGFSWLRLEFAPTVSDFKEYCQKLLPDQPQADQFRCAWRYGHPTIDYCGQPLFALNFMSKRGVRQHTESIRTLRIRKALHLPWDTDLRLEQVGWQYFIPKKEISTYEEFAYKLIELSLKKGD